MGKRKRNATKKARYINRYTRFDFEMRPVTKLDKWCKFRTQFKVPPDPDAPYGYLIVIPNYFDGMNLYFEGDIIKSKLFMGTLYLQIIPKKSNKSYSTLIYTRVKKRSKKPSSYLNIKNMSKKKY